MSAGNFLKKQSDRFKACIEAVDMAFVSLRIILFCGGIGWLVFSDISQDTFANASRVFLFFAVYSVFIYVWLFISPLRKKYIYGIALLFDLILASLLVSVTGGFQSSFLNGFYLITALYSFYYGLIPGTIIAAVASGLYFVSSGYEISVLHWTDFFVRISFMFLLAVPLGMLSQKLKKDKSHIEVLNKDLEKYIEELRSVQGKLIQVEKLSALGRLTADVAHEIRNPLTSIGGFARRLNNRLSKGSREKDYAEIVVTEVDRLERILRDVLTFSQETKSEMEYQEVNGIVREALKTYEGMCADQTVSIDMDLHSPLPLVLIDKDQVRLALNNLITNAIDVMPRGGVLTVKTHTEELSHVEYIAVEVMDTGPGLPNEALNMIFEPFFTTKEIGAGTGLGLSICKKIADENNGLIFVVSELGKGTTFKIMFPYQKEEDRVKIMCWEYTKCGVENAEGAANMRCPAYPDYGRICWTIAGTFCGKRVSGAIAQKLGDCKKCDFYKRVAVQKDM
jgi:signal transduction histidine kinase